MAGAEAVVAARNPLVILRPYSPSFPLNGATSSDTIGGW